MTLVEYLPYSWVAYHSHVHSPELNQITNTKLNFVQCLISMRVVVGVPQMTLMPCVSVSNRLIKTIVSTHLGLKTRNENGLGDIKTRNENGLGDIALTSEFSKRFQHLI